MLFVHRVMELFERLCIVDNFPVESLYSFRYSFEKCGEDHTDK